MSAVVEAHETSKEQPIRVERDGGILTLTNADAPINRMTLAFMNQLEELIEAAAEDPSIRVIVITAEGDTNFSVGMDLKQLGSVKPEDQDALFDQRLRVEAMRR